MIYTREEFEKRLRKMKKSMTLKELLKEGGFGDIIYNKIYNRAIDDVIRLIEDEGGCFRE